ncbi:MAG: 50S ribosomal protein L25 [Spirochaetes bacterium]|nr:50S ribosomal protein L25 [Spirochaetota bacterium]
MQTHLLNAQVRTKFGKNEAHRLRSQGFIPVVMYSHGKSESLQVSSKDIYMLFRGHVSESMLLNLTITNRNEDREHQVFVKDYQMNPITDELTHIDFFKITEGEKIHTKVPVEITGTAKGVRNGGILEFVERELVIECLPTEIPEKITIDVTNLDIGDSIHIGAIPVSGSLKFLSDNDRVVVTVLVPTKVAEPVAVEGVPAEGEAAAAAPTEEKKDDKKDDKKDEKKKDDKKK